jgi:hypothetical protein
MALKGEKLSQEHKDKISAGMKENARKRKARLTKINPQYWKIPISYKVPFDREGNVPFYPINSFHFTKDGRYKENDQTFKWKDNFEFEDTLQYVSCVKTQKSLQFNMTSVITGRKYTMFLIDFLNMIKSYDLNKGVVHTIWTFTKMGACYGIVPTNIRRKRPPYKNRGVSPTPEALEARVKARWGNHRKAEPPSTV